MKLYEILPDLVAKISQRCPWIVGDRPDTHLLTYKCRLAKGVEWIVRRKANGFYERMLFEFSQISKDGAVIVAIQFATSPLNTPLIPAGPFGWYGSILDLDILGADHVRELHWSGPWFSLGETRSQVVANWEELLKTLVDDLSSRLELEERKLSENTMIRDLQSMLCDELLDRASTLQKHPLVTSIPNWERYFEFGNRRKRGQAK